MNTSHSNFKPDVKGMTLTVTLHGKQYVACDKQQMHAIMQMGKQRVALEAAENNETLTPEEEAKRLEAWQENCGFATVEWLLSKMSPQERERWKASYRFSGIHRSFG